MELEQDTYLSIEGQSEGFYKEKGSKFLAYAFPVTSEEEIKEAQEVLRKKHYDARHHCYAWALGRDGTHYRANDDGEPNHSAGDPILGQIRSFNLSDVLVIVVRYFGGTKLGVGGLISAYKTAAAEALSAARVVPVTVMHTYQVSFTYPDMNEVMRAVKDFDAEVVSQDFGMECRMVLRVRETRSEAFADQFTLSDTIKTKRKDPVEEI
ncbi:YigZ family protein [Roseivirga sp. BDSF3-8]|uniref:IMPACT family protein n=1 Tax=Roseivirga sp. BDSF3-8 TaxID=3241598 RepID=UPI0035320629